MQLAQSWYLRLAEIAGISSGVTTGLDYDHFTTTCVILAISFEELPLSESIRGPTEVGNLALELRFSQALQQSIGMYSTLNLVNNTKLRLLLLDIICLGLFHDCLMLHPQTRILSSTFSPQSFG